MTELDEVERPSTPRAPGGPAPNPTATPPTAGASKLSSTDTAKTTDQSTAAGANQAAQGAPGVSNKQSPAASGTKANQEQQAKAESAIDSPDELHDPDTTTADFVSVRVHTRSRSQRSRRQQTQQQNPRETPDNLAATSAEDKAALETCGRHFAAKRLESLGYKVTPMSQGNPGFDLKGEKPGDIIEVEVKAHAGESSSVFITQRECFKFRNKVGLDVALEALRTAIRA